MSEVTAIGFTTPIFVTIGAAIFLGEKLKIHRIASVLIGFIGTLIILRPGLQEVSLGQLSQLAAAPLFAISFSIAKQLTKHVNADVIVAMLSAMCTLVLLPGALIDWQTPTVNEVFWLAVTAGFATFGHFAKEPCRSRHSRPLRRRLLPGKVRFRKRRRRPLRPERHAPASEKQTGCLPACGCRRFLPEHHGYAKTTRLGVHRHNTGIRRPNQNKRVRHEPPAPSGRALR